MSDAAEQQFGGWMKQTYEMGDKVQRTAIDLMFLKPPSMDSSALMRMADEMKSGAFFQFAVNYMAPPMAWVDGLRVSAIDKSATQHEFANKLYIISLVTQVEHQLGLADSAHTPLAEIVERARKLESFPRLWAVEGIGNWYTERAWDKANGADPVNVLTDDAAAGIPAWSLTMLNAGIGMSFANRLLKKLGDTPTADQVAEAVTRFERLCRDSASPGYAGAALESLGLATRTLYPNLVMPIHQDLERSHPDLVAYFWHGAGRATYFDPMTMLPSSNAPWSALDRIVKDAPSDLARLNMISGLSWAITVVNMRHPEVMESFLRHHAESLRANGAFHNGMTSALLMRYDTSYDDPFIHPFFLHEPAADDTVLVSAWKSMIAEPAEFALTTTYRQLREANQLEELFRYVPATA